MGPFNDISLEWAGKEYAIKARRVMGAIKRIEEEVTYFELMSYVASNDPRTSKIAAAYGVILRYAGASITDEQVYEGLFGKTGIPNPDLIAKLIAVLLGIMSPKGPLKQDFQHSGKEPDQGNASPIATTASSKARTKSRSGSGA